jgi:asparagine synthase (glutamine-hydrolysing)
MRTAYPLASHLSGGIDSSPIAIYAARQLQKKSQTLHAFNWIDIPMDDETYEYEAWSFSHEIAQRENIHHIEFSITPQDVVEMLDRHNIFTHGFVYGANEDKVRNIATQYQIRTILSGWGGDELISYGGYTYMEGLFAQGKLSTAFSTLLGDKKRLNLSWIGLVKRTLRVLYSWFKITWLYRFQADDSEDNCYRYVTPQFRRFMKHHKSVAYPNTVGVRKMQSALFRHGHLHSRIESWDICGKADKIEYRYPLLDKRIVEFALTIPEPLYFPDEKGGRALFRSALADLLPKDIINFLKKDEIKVAHSFEKLLLESYVLLQQKDSFAKDNTDEYVQNYIDESQIQSVLQKLDSNVTNLKKMDNILPGILLSNSIKKCYTIKTILKA